MSLSFPSSGGWDPSSKKTLGWRASSTRRAGPATEPVAPAARWARLRNAAPVPLPSLEAAGSAPPPSFDTQDSALRATQQFQQGERESQLRSQLDLLTSISRATRTAIESTASLLRAQNAGSEKKTNFIVEEIGKVRRAVHTADARHEIRKQGTQTVETVREILKSFAVAQEKTLAKAVSAIYDVDKRLKWTEDTMRRIAKSQEDIAEKQKKQDERLRNMGDIMGKLISCQRRQEQQAQEERREPREWHAKRERDLRAKRRANAARERTVDVSAHKGMSQNSKGRKYGSVGNEQVVQNGIERSEYSQSSEEVVDGREKRTILAKRRNENVMEKGSVRHKLQLATVYSNSDSYIASQFVIEPDDSERDGSSDGRWCDEEDADSLFLDDSVKKEMIPAESFPLSTPGEAPWMYVAGMNDRDTDESFPSIPLVLRRRRPGPTIAKVNGRKKTRRKR